MASLLIKVNVSPAHDLAANAIPLLPAHSARTTAICLQIQRPAKMTVPRDILPWALKRLTEAAKSAAKTA